MTIVTTVVAAAMNIIVLVVCRSGWPVGGSYSRYQSGRLGGRKTGSLSFLFHLDNLVSLIA